MQLDVLERERCRPRALGTGPADPRAATGHHRRESRRKAAGAWDDIAVGGDLDREPVRGDDERARIPASGLGAHIVPLRISRGSWRLDNLHSRGIPTWPEAQT